MGFKIGVMYVLWMKHEKRCYLSRDYRKIVLESGMDESSLARLAMYGFFEDAGYGYYEDDDMVFTRENVIRL